MPQKEDAVTELALSLGMLVRRLRAAAAAETSGLSLPHLAVISRLAKEGPATTADLARGEGMKPQSMGAIIAALEALRLVERRPHATDGRQVLIALTSRGVAARRSVREAKRSWLAQAIARLDKQEQATLLAAGPIFRRLVER